LTLTFDQAMTKYIDGEVTFEQFMFVAIGIIKKDVDELKKRMVVEQ